MMNRLAFYWKKVKLRGWEGIRAYASWRYNQYVNKRFYIRNARIHANTVPERGITLISDLGGSCGICKALRDFAESLRDANIPFQVGFKSPSSMDPSGKGLDELLVSKRDFNIQKYSHVIELVEGVVPPNLVPNHYNLAFWEFESGFPEAFPTLVQAPGLLAMSDFNANYFRSVASAKTDVRKILYPFRSFMGKSPDVQEARARFGIPQKAFTVFFNFDLGSSFQRKNPDGAMRAFSEAFCSDPDVFMVFKCNHAEQFPSRVRQIASLSEELGISTRFKMVAGYLKESDIRELTAACDVYLSLHRGEGFGIGIAEAMSMGKPVVVTNYSAPCEFCNADNAMLIPYCLVPAKPPENGDIAAYFYVKEWAEPDVSAAAEALRRLRHDPALRNRIGDAARRSIANQFSIDKFRESVKQFLSPHPVISLQRRQNQT